MLTKQMSLIINKYLRRVLSFAIALLTSFIFLGSPSYAAKSSMTGDYSKDTITVVKFLKEAIDTPKDSSNKDEVRVESLSLITDYISRYRNGFIRAVLHAIS